MASLEASSPRVTFAARVPNCLTASVAASVATVAERCARDVGIFSLSRAMLFILRTTAAAGAFRRPSPRSLTGLHGPGRRARLHTVRTTCEPGTMSSDPSFQRTQAFLPPS